MLTVHALHLYFALATGAILPLFASDNFIFAHTVYVFIYAALLLGRQSNLHALLQIVMVASPFFLSVLIGLFRAEDLQYALQKAEGAALSTILVALITFHCIRHHDVESFLRAFVSTALVILCVTFLIRAASGYQIGDRTGRFLVNGPIVFGWMMGLSALLSLQVYYLTAQIRFVLLFTIFGFAVLVTGSKGPAIALLVGTALAVLFRINSIRTAVICLCFAVLCFLFFAFVPSEITSRFSAIQRFISGEIGLVDEGSIGVRSDAWVQSLRILLDHPVIGVGLGNWAQHSSVNGLIYPHNFILEIGSELGFSGLFALAISLSCILRRADSIISTLIVFFLTCLSFSGDLSYLRFALGLPLGLAVARYVRNRKVLT